MALVGLIEGVAEATASVTKVFSGWLSDRLGKRKLLAVIGYGLGALTKPVFPLAVTPFEVLGARFVDRIGKGIRGAPIRWAEVWGMDRAYWAVVGVGVVFTLARFSEAFLLLRGSDAGLSPVLVPLVLVAMNLAYAVVSAPAGSLSDHVDRRVMLGGGLVALIVADIVLAVAPTIAGVLAAAAIWGVHMGLTQGLLSAWIADSAPDRLRGTAFGILNLATGLTLFVASALAGVLWSMLGPAATFLAGAAFALLALAGGLRLRTGASCPPPTGDA